MNKVTDILDAVAKIRDGNVVLVGGFGPMGYPGRILRTLLKQTETKELFFVANAPNPSYMPSMEKLLEKRSRGTLGSAYRVSDGSRLTNYGMVQLYMFF